MKTVAIILAAGSGKRMGGTVKKQYMLLDGQPILYYSLKAFSDSFIDEIVLVTSKEDIEMIKNDIIAPNNFTKVTKIVEGGKERYHSVLNGLNAIKEASYVFIHDGARPLVDGEILNRALDSVKENKACVVGVKSKDTVKIATDDGFVESTPDRNLVWNIQTPQVFDFELIKEAYNDIVPRENELKKCGINITDDAMVLEQYNGYKIGLVLGSYENIKVTTPDDLLVAEKYLKNR